MKRNLMKRAHEIAKRLEGDYRARMSIALRQAWKEEKGAMTVDKKAKFETREDALKHVNTANKAVAKKQTETINMMYDFGLKVSLNELENIELDCHQDNMKKAMSY